MAEKPHKLAALRLLNSGMRELEKLRQQRIERGEDAAEVDRATAQVALTAVVAFFQDYGIERQPLIRLLAEVAALSAGSSPSRMLRPVATRHRRPDAPAVEMIKGRLAAIMEFRQQAGSTRKAAAEWVVRHVPPDMKRQLGAVTRATVDSWLVKWGGDHGATAGDGRDGYLAMRAFLQRQRLTEAQLQRLTKGLARWLPS